MAETSEAELPLTRKDVARRFAVHPATVTRWTVEGKLRYWKTPGGRHRFDAAEVDRFYAEQFGPSPAPAA